MTTYLYLRTSDAIEDIESQQTSLRSHWIIHKDKLGEAEPEVISDDLGSTETWSKRELGRALFESKTGDTIIVTELSRLGRNAKEVLEILADAASNGIAIIIVKDKIYFNQSYLTTQTATTLRLALKINKHFISMRSENTMERIKELNKGLAPQYRKQIGRPVPGSLRADGTIVPLPARKLDKFSRTIGEMLAKKMTRVEMADKLGVNQRTLSNWIADRRPEYALKPNESEASNERI